MAVANLGVPMTHFDDLLIPKALSTSLSVTGKKQLFQKLSDMAAHAYGLDSVAVYERLTERERLGSTGFGGGIAIPHAKMDGLEKVRGLVVLLDTPIAFDAVDNAPVDVVFALLSPLDSGAEHLKTLARVSRYLRNEGQISRLRGVGSDEALFALLSGAEARDAA
ncbi:PTS IIA-like nitrogen regulatory protein PtsN [soil metagenome]